MKIMNNRHSDDFGGFTPNDDPIQKKPPPPPPNRTMTSMGFSRKEAIVLIALPILALITTFFVSCIDSKPHDETKAKLEVQYYIESMLKSPSTAEFGCEEVLKIKENTYHVEGCVDAQNGFGAMIRKYYECDIKFTKDGKKYSVSNFEME